MRILGRESDGVVWEGAIEEERDEEEAVGEGVDDAYLKEERRRAFTLDSSFKPLSPIHDYEDESDKDSDSATDLDPSSHQTHAIDNPSDSDYEDGAHSDSATTPSASHHRSQFMGEASELIRHALDSSYSIDNAALELNGLKFACNASFRDCQHAILSALFSRSDPADLPKSITKLWATWGPLLAKFTHGPQEQRDLISMVCSLCRSYNRLPDTTSPPPFERAFNLCIPLLYKTDVIDDEAVLAWYTAESTLHGEDNLYCRQIKSFVTWLEAESESDDDDEDDDSCSDSD